MVDRFLWVVEPSIKDFFLPLKGPFEVLTLEELPQRLHEGRKAGWKRVGMLVFSEETLSQTRKILSLFPEMEFLFAESHGEEALRAGLALLSDGLRPQEIEEESFRLIESIVNLEGYPAEVRTVVRRVIHATGDPAWIKTLRLHPRAVETGVRLLREGCDVVVDVEMLRAAINQRGLSRLGGRVLCGLSDVPEVPSGKTRTEAALEKVLSANPRIGIVAVGNSPTALLAALRLLQKGPREVLIVGLPVGFVKAAEAKLLLLLQDRPYITNLGPRGGSAAAAAVVNAIINLAHGQTTT